MKTFVAIFLAILAAAGRSATQALGPNDSPLDLLL
jgi:hypothetical protein